jgi:PhoPQ-activated pathogenicity-related protein
VSHAPRVSAAALVSLVGLAALAAAADGPPRPEDALAAYVAKADASYEWTLRARYTQRGAAIVGLHLISQIWGETLWQHELYLIRPEGLESVTHGVLVVAGGRWRADLAAMPAGDVSLSEDAEQFIAIARRMKAVVAVVGQVPFQPLFGLSEDRLIAHTFERYLAGRDAESPLLLPMVKSAVRAMDAAREAAAAEWGLELDTFTVLGASKRGWTSLLTAAVDRRVTAVAPIVFDAVNMRLHFPHEIDVWGAPSEEIQPYTDLDLPNILSSEQGRDLREIVDPFSYRQALTQPKLIVAATNDRYFPVDSLNLYWDDLVGRKYILYVPNSGHDISDLPYVVRSLTAFNRDAAAIARLPAIAWEFLELPDELVLCVAAEPAPRHLRLWTATASTRDFREARWGAREVGAAGSEAGTAEVLRLPAPESGYAAVYAELEFGRRRRAFALTTNVAIFGTPGAPTSTPVPRGTPGTCPQDLG